MVATQIFFIFPLPGEMIQVDEHIFQRGLKHQVEMYGYHIF